MHVSVEKFFENYSGALEKVKTIIKALLKSPLSETPDDIRSALSMAILTPDDVMRRCAKRMDGCFACLKM